MLCHLPEKLPAHNNKENVVITKRKVTSVRPNLIDQKFPFKFTIICEKHKEWYLANNNKNNTENECHYNNSPLHYDHKAIKRNHLSVNITNFMKKMYE